MTVNQLIAALQLVIAGDAYLGDAAITFGNAMEPVEGGIIAKHRSTGLVVLNLAPTRLDRVGGF